MTKQPYLSIVVAGRNDNYGGDFEQRLQNCITWYCYYADKYKLDTEFLVVNYNPVADRPQLKEVIQFPKSDFVQFRMIPVPNACQEKISDVKVRKKKHFN
ncbi:MAG: hypothetical protein JWO06_2222 [Bacteroidota bacterium]|nr:hypothetical protein [Bacteroidota bacterium]